MIQCNLQDAIKYHKTGKMTIVCSFVNEYGENRFKVSKFYLKRGAVRILSGKGVMGNIIYTDKFFAFDNAIELVGFLNEVTPSKTTQDELNRIF